MTVTVTNEVLFNAYRFDVRPRIGTKINGTGVGTMPTLPSFVVSHGFTDSDFDFSPSVGSTDHRYFTNPFSYYTGVAEGSPFYFPRGVTFNPTFIDHAPIANEDEDQAKIIKIKVSLDNPIALLFLGDFMDLDIHIALWEVFNPKRFIITTYTDYTSKTIKWMGKVTACVFNYDEQFAELQCIDYRKVIQHKVLGAAVQSATCQKVLYSETCSINPHAANTTYFLHREDGFITGYDPTTQIMTVDCGTNRSDGFFSAGFVVVDPLYINKHLPRSLFDFATEWDSINNGIFLGVKKLIAKHTGNELKLQEPFVNAPAIGTKVSIFTSCDKNKETCKNKFSNFTNFGGYPWIPVNNVFVDGIKS